jgi:hypothetical protein
MPVRFGVGDHQLFVINFETTALVGLGLCTIIRPALCHLNTKIKGCAQWYNTILQWNICCHCLFEQMVAASSSSKSKDAVSAKLNMLDWEGEAYMKHAKKKCCWLKSGRIPFSPEALLWICQCQVYPSLLWWHAGKIGNWGNLKCTAWQCQINAPFQLSVEDIKLHLMICKEKCNYFCKHGKRHQQQHLNHCLKAAQEQKDKAAEHQIHMLIKREKDRAFWRWLNFALGRHICSRSVWAVQVEDGVGGVLDFDTEEGVQEAIFNEVHRKQYNLAEDAPICKGTLWG